jgi:hypothetical protein
MHKILDECLHLFAGTLEVHKDVENDKMDKIEAGVEIKYMYLQKRGRT